MHRAGPGALGVLAALVSGVTLIGAAALPDPAWSAGELSRLRRACPKGPEAPVGYCECIEALVVERWKTPKEFRAEFETDEGTLEVAFIATECQKTVALRASASKDLGVSLGPAWTRLGEKAREELRRNGYAVDAAFVHGQSGQLGKGQPIVGFRLANEIVGREPFRRSNVTEGPEVVCNGSAAGDRAPRLKGEFHEETLTLHCEGDGEIPGVGSGRTVYVMQFFRSRVVIMDTFVRHDSRDAYKEVVDALRGVIKKWSTEDHSE